MSYIIYWLSSGQQHPEGSTYIRLTNDGTIWVGAEEDFPIEAVLGKKLDTDPDFATTYNHRLATQDEIDEYNNPPEPVEP